MVVRVMGEFVYVWGLRVGCCMVCIMVIVMKIDIWYVIFVDGYYWFIFGLL